MVRVVDADLKTVIAACLTSFKPNHQASVQMFREVEITHEDAIL